MINKKNLFLLISMMSGSNLAMGAQFTPSEACGFLSNLPFINEETVYKLIEGTDRYACSTPYFIIQEKNPYTLSNNIAYYTYGSNTDVDKLLLILNINNKKSNTIQTSKKYFIEGSSELIKKAFPDSKDKTSNIINNIKKGKYGQWNVEGWSVSSKREDWPGGNGYDLRFEIKEN